MIYFYHGENRFDLGRATEAMATDFVKAHGIDTVVRLDAGEMDAQNLIAEIVNINMFAPERLMIVKGLENARAAWEKLGENLGRVPDGTDLLVVATKPDKRTRTYKELLKSAETREFPILQGANLQKWLVDEMLATKLKADREALDELLALTSGDDNPQARLAAEITKFKALGQTVTIDLVRQIVEPNLAANAYEILNLVLRGERSRVADELKTLRVSGEDANKFFGLLASQVFALAAAVLAGSGTDTARNLKIHPFQLAQMTKLARGLGDDAIQKRRVKKIVRVLAGTDAKMKLARADEAWTLIEVGLAKITS